VTTLNVANRRIELVSSPTLSGSDWYNMWGTFVQFPRHYCKEGTEPPDAADGSPKSKRSREGNRGSLPCPALRITESPR
jgi:hypothetical protein